MRIDPNDAKRLLAELAKARHLVLMGDEDGEDYAYSPFPYDKKFFDRLKPHQVPRFLRCLTDPQKLPLKIVYLDNLQALQNRVEIKKVESIRSLPTNKEPVVVRIREDDMDTIADGLHRMSANWLDHVDSCMVRYCDLSDKMLTVEPVPGAGAFDAAEERAENKL